MGSNAEKNHEPIYKTYIKLHKYFHQGHNRILWYYLLVPAIKLVHNLPS